MNTVRSLTKRKYKDPNKLKNTITEMKNTITGTKGRLDEIEEWINKLIWKTDSWKSSKLNRKKKKRILKSEDDLKT